MPFALKDGFLCNSSMRRRSLISLIVFSAVFTLLSICDIRHPISQPDENIVINNLACASAGDYHNTAGVVVRLFNVVPVVFFSNYHACLDQYFFVPFLKFFQPHVAIHIAGVFIGLFTLLFTFLFVRDFFGQSTALITTLLLSVNTVFVMGMRFSVVTGSAMQLFAVAALYFFWRWYRLGHIGALYAGVFLLGAGCTIRIMFLWFIVAIGILALVNRKLLLTRLLNQTPGNRFKPLILSPLLFLTATLPLVYFNISAGFPTVQFLADTVITASGKMSGAGYLASLNRSMGMYSLLLKGNFVTLYPVKRTFFSLFGNGFYPSVLAACACWVAFTAWTGDIAHAKRRAFILSLFVLLVAQVTLMTFRAFPHHFYSTFPFPFILIGVTIRDLFSSRRRHVLKMVGTALLIALVGTDLLLAANRHYCAWDGGYAGQESDCIYPLVDWLKKNDVRSPVAMDRSIMTMLMIQPEKAIQPRGFISEATPSYDEFLEQYATAFKDPRSIYVFYYDDSAYHRVENRSLLYKYTRRFMQENQKRMQEIKYFWQPNGRLVYIVARII